MNGTRETSQAARSHWVDRRHLPLRSANQRPRITVLRRLLALTLAVFLFACANGEPPELAQAADAFEDMLKPVNFSRSMYVVAFSDGTPSQYVSYLFSDMGSAEWPPSEAWADDMLREQMAAIGQSLLPADVAIVSLSPDLGHDKQLVISFDDEQGVVIATGYLDPVSEPVLTRTWKLPEVEPAPGVEMIYRANLESGMSAQSFPAP